MSALIRESHANETTALFLSPIGNSSISGNLNVGGNVDVGGNVNVGGEITVNGFSNLFVGGTTTFQANVETKFLFTMYSGTFIPNPAFQIVPLINGNAALQTDGSLIFTRLNSTAPPQTLFTPSAAVNGDVLTVGGAVNAVTLSGIGPAPISQIAGPVTVTSPTAPAPLVGVPVTTNVPTQAGWEFDVEIKGDITLASGVADPDDVVLVQVDTGSLAPAVWNWYFKPQAVNLPTGEFSIRTRMISDATTPTVFCGVQTYRNGASTAVYDVQIVQQDVTRVK
jgi:hypothetical protein